MIEIEDKYDVEPGFVMPALDEIAADVSVAEPRTDELEAVYYDTADYRLARNQMTLRRRTGGTDAGWHLKLPADVGRNELRRPLGQARRPPRELSQLVFARTRGQAIAPVATLRTHRTTHALLGDDGAVLAEVADDEVSAQVFGDGGHELELSAWREVEVELVSGDSRLLKRVGKQLRGHGARASRRPSKLAGVLGERLAAGPDVALVEGRLTKRSPAGEVVRDYLMEQLQTMLAQDVRVRLDEPESIHDMRVATRRLRSTLGTYRRLLDEDAARDLEARLRQLAAELGTVRDNEVLLERLRTAVQAQPEELVLGPVQRRLQEELQGAALVGRTQLLKVMNGRDYAVLIDDLIAFVTTGVSRDGAAAKPAKDVLPKLIGRRYRKLAARAHHATEVAGGEQDVALHSTRKAAKQLRYAAEAVIPAFGSDAKGLAKSAEEVQEVLGEHQDGVVAAGVLRRLALVAQSHADESAFTFGLLVGVEQARAEAARREFDRAWRRSSAKHHLRRLRRT